SVSVFFFQAEDGIRDRNVTGVQTCALPIWPDRATEAIRARHLPGSGVRRLPAPAGPGSPGEAGASPHRQRGVQGVTGRKWTKGEIGRASCRERGATAGGGVTLEENSGARGS